MAWSDIVRAASETYGSEKGLEVSSRRPTVRTSLVLICALVFLASPYFFAYLEAERLLGWPSAVYLWVDPWLPLVTIIATSLITLALPLIVNLFSAADHGLRS